MTALLAADVLAAAGPDRSLDSRIAHVVGHHDPIDPPYYTSSWDAAVNLVPAGWGFMILHDTGARYDVMLYKTGTPFSQPFKAATPVLSICAAALTARSQDVTKR